MAQSTPPRLSQRTEYSEPDNDSDMDSGVWDDAGDDADSCLGSTVTEEEKVNEQDGTEENGGGGRAFTVFVAFQGNMEDEDFTQKLDSVLIGIPNMLDMGLFNFVQLLITLDKNSAGGVFVTIIEKIYIHAFIY